MKKICCIAIFLLGISLASAQRPPLDHTVYDQWKSLSHSAISPSGQFIYYTVSAQEGDGYTVLKDRKNNVLLHVDRGSSPILTDDEAYLITNISPFYAEKREARIKKKKPDEMPKDSLIVFSTKHRTGIKYGAVKSYKVAQKPQNHIVFVQEIAPPVTKDTSRSDSVDGSMKKSKAAKSPKPQPVLVLANLSTQDTLHLGNVDQYSISPNEKYVVFTKKYEGKDSSKNDILHVLDLQNRHIKVISHGKGTYKHFTFDDQEQQLIFLADKSPAKSLTKNFKLYHYDFSSDTAQVIVDRYTPGVPEAWYVSGDGSLRFDSQGRRILLGLAPVPPPKDTSIVDFEQAKVDVWHWKDETLMTQQLANLRRDLAKSYDAIYHVQAKTLIPLMDDSLDRITYTDSMLNDWAIASSYDNRLATQWLGYSVQKLYLVSLMTGAKKLIRDNFVGQSYLSPTGRHLLMFDAQQGHWQAYDIPHGTTRTLTDNIAVQFANEENDMPTFAGSYGLAGWAKDKEGVYIYDRYDIWYFGLDEETSRCITLGSGRQKALQFRAIHLHKNLPRQRHAYIEEGKKLLLSSFNTRDKKRGIFELNLKKNTPPKEIIQAPFTYSNIAADAQATRFVYSKENFENSPDLYWSTDFIREQRVSDINPQQRNYNWGTAELVRWTTPQGYDAEGIVYKPENFDPYKQYPVIAYFYETLTEGLYSYHAPAPTPSRLNIPYFVSNEYIVFVPDIRYEIGHPGKSAEEYVNSGMRHLARYPWVDSTKMGIQGQSWGGYQVAHLITRTPMYAAAWAGAPVVNMTSAYGGIRWQTGMSRQFQYEHTQSRIGQNLWENKELYIQNSPLFYLDKVTTPVVIMSNDNDGAVPWYQGIEMFMALRRLGKPSWMLNYNGDAHNLIQRPNRKDIQIRQSQFFDHFLKGKEAPQWLKTGVPAIKKGIDWGLN